MLCQKCHKNLATVRYAEVVDGHVTEQHLCAQCLAVHQKDAAAGFELSGSGPALRKPPADRTAQDPNRAQRSCPSCGTPLSRVLDEGVIGCADCYKTFGSEIESILEGLHPGVVHKGKVAQLDDSRARLRADLQGKRALLRTMLKAEKYEDAAALRDEIRCLEGGLSPVETGME